MERHPADYRPGDEFAAGSPYAIDASPLQEGIQALRDVAWLCKVGVSKAQEGEVEAAIVEAEDALIALEDAIAFLKEARKQ